MKTLAHQPPLNQRFNIFHGKKQDRVTTPEVSHVKFSALTIHNKGGGGGDIEHKNASTGRKLQLSWGKPRICLSMRS